MINFYKAMIALTLVFVGWVFYQLYESVRLYNKYCVNSTEYVCTTNKHGDVIVRPK